MAIEQVRPRMATQIGIIQNPAPQLYSEDALRAMRRYEGIRAVDTSKSIPVEAGEMHPPQGGTVFQPGSEISTGALQQIKAFSVRSQEKVLLDEGLEEEAMLVRRGDIHFAEWVAPGRTPVRDTHFNRFDRINEYARPKDTIDAPSHRF